MRASNLFDFVYAVLSVMFLHQIDAIQSLVDDLKVRFSREWVILKGINPGLRLDGESSYDSEVAQEENGDRFASPDNLKALAAELRGESLPVFPENEDDINRVETEEKSTQTDGPTEDVAKMFSLGDLPLERLFLPGEND